MDASQRSRLALYLFIAALAAGAHAYSRGELTVSILVVFPLVTGTGPWALLAMLLFFAAFIAYASAAVVRAASNPDHEDSDAARERDRVGAGTTPSSPEARRVRSSGVLLIGPIPIVWGRDTRTVIILAIVAVALTLFAVWLTYAGPFARP